MTATHTDPSSAVVVDISLRRKTPPCQDLSRFSDDALIDAIIRLTHTVHDVRRTDPLRADDFRARRNVARAELLRRLAQS